MSTIAYEVREKIGVVTIQSPPANALSTKLLDDLSKTLDEIENDNNVKAVILRGEGKFFSAGADIKEFTSLQKASDYQALSKKGQNLFKRIEHFSIPVIAAIHGAALGGGLELAMACHMRFVTENTKMGLPETNLGIIPGFAGTQRLPYYVGTAKAYEMILTGTPVSGAEAETAGLANKAFKEDELMDEVLKIARLIASKSKPGINKVMELVPYAKNASFSEGEAEEAKAFGEVFGSNDAKEGVQAFIEKRKPSFMDN